MYSIIPKIKILEFLLENKRCVSRNLIFKVYNFLCKHEGVQLEYTEILRNKIRYTLNYLEKRWKLISRRKTAKNKFLNLCSKQRVEFLVEIKDQTNRKMDIDPKPIEVIFSSLQI